MTNWYLFRFNLKRCRDDHLRLDSPGAGSTSDKIMDSNKDSQLEQLRAENERLRHDAHRYRALAEAWSDIVWIMDEEGRGDGHRQWFADFTGIPLEELRANPARWHAAVHPEDSPWLQMAWLTSIQEGKPYQHEFRLRRRDDIYSNVRLRGAPVHDQQGKVVEWVGTINDFTAQKAVEEQLRESQQQFSQLAEHISAVFWLMALPGRQVLYVNPAFERVWGLQRERLYEDVCVMERHIHPDDFARVMDELRAHPKDEPFVTEYRIVRPDGQVRWLEDRAFPVRNEAGDIYRMCGFAEDITARKQVEETLRVHSEFTRTVLESNPDCLKVLDGTGRLQFMNANGRCLMEIDEFAPLENQFWWNLWPVEAQTVIRHAVRQAQQGETAHFQAFCPTAKGTPKWWDVVVAPVPGVDGQPTRLISVSRDITERKQQEDALRQSEERLNLAIEGAHLGTFDWNITTGRVQWSSKLEAMMAMEPGTFDGTLEGFQKIVHPDDCAKVEERIAVALREGHYECEFRMLKGDGGVRWVLTKGLVIFDDRKQPVRMVGVDIDITARKQAELDRAELLEKERAARAEAEAANRAKDEFLALVSHELRNPLHLMLGWTRLLRSHSDAQVAKVMGIIERAAKAQQQLIEDLLDSARMVTGKLRLDTRPLDLLMVVHSALDAARSAADAKRILLITDYRLAEEQVTGDPDRLQQVIWNLLSNAVKFTSEGGTVTVSLERRSPYVCIIVQDTGKGITPDLLPYVFEPFRQSTEAGGGRRQGGLGLGLSLVKQLVELHGGTVEAGSEGVGKGATFTVWLPLRAVRGEVTVEGQKAQPVPITELPVSLTGKRILVLDDEADARSVITKTLTQCDAEVRAVATGTEAMEALTRGAWRPDVLISDIQMPDEDGIAFMRRVRALAPEQGKTLPAIALTAYNARQDRIQALQAGFQAHLVKPVEPLELVLTVASLTSS
ncbi:MAG TPA: PAS domain-containing protein [Blastocatellia bacterium]|nr:PAS domain-containing protein [Blastocatellia bacterium]